MRRPILKRSILKSSNLKRSIFKPFTFKRLIFKRLNLKEKKSGRLTFFLRSSVLVLLWLILASHLAGAELLAREKDSTSQDLAVVMVIDISGSMARTDPERLREVASRIFIDLLGEEDHLGIMIFDNQAEVVIPLQPIKSAANRESIKETMSARLDPRSATDFEGALILAREMFEDVDLEGRQPVILKLTDGEPNPDPQRRDDADFMAAHLEDLWEVVASLDQKNIPIYTVGFSDEIDPEVIRKISEGSRGSYYILTEPVELLATFFDVLGDLKNRQTLLEERVDLDEGPREFTFTAGDNTRQVNLIAVSLSGSARVSVTPPRGAPGDMDNLTVQTGDNYHLVVLSHPDREQYGTWKVEVRGEGEVEVAGKEDQYIKAFLAEPAPDAQHPIHEPLNLAAEVVIPESMKNLPLQVEARVTPPGSRQPQVVLLEEDGDAPEGYYRGSYGEVAVPGEYQLQLRVLADDEPIFVSDFAFSVERIPVLATDFWVEDRVFQLGGETLVTASLQYGGDRLQEGGTLQVNEFQLVLDYRGGERTELDLHDSGKEEHGDIRADDGIWSNRLTFEEEGEAGALLQASGVYRGTDFLVEKPLGEVKVSLPGVLTIEETGRNLWATPGGELELPLRIDNDTPFSQKLNFSLSGGSAKLLQERLLLDPGDNRQVTIPLEISDTVEIGELNFAVNFELEDSLTEVTPGRMDFQVDILSPGAAWMREIMQSLITAGWVALGGVLIGGGFYLGGNFLNRFYLSPRLQVDGFLQYQRNDKLDYSGEPAGESEEEESGTNWFKLRKAKKKQIVISFNGRDTGADFYMKSLDSHHKLIIKNYWNEHLPSFVRGWKALLSRPIMVQTVVECTPPGVLEVNGVTCTKKELYHTDEFETGGYAFQYFYYIGQWHQESRQGMDVLEGKV